MRTAPIWSRMRKVSRMLLALNSLKLSAQSPPWRTKARPMAASARRSSRWRASPANTTGGNVSIVLSTESSSSWLGYSGSCSAFFAFQLSTVHFPNPTGFFSGAATVDGDEAFAAA
ncbi:Os07g0622250, partial [Oryza sativa Japonica Group]